MVGLDTIVREKGEGWWGGVGGVNKEGPMFCKTGGGWGCLDLPLVTLCSTLCKVKTNNHWLAHASPRLVPPSCFCSEF